MDFASAITAIQGSNLEQSKEISDFLTQRFKELEQGVNQREQRIESLTNQISGIVEAAGVEGSELSQRVSNTTKKIELLTNQLNEAKQQVEAEQTRYQMLERSARVKDAARNANANPNVLQTLLKPEDKVEIRDGSAVVNGQSLKEWAEANHQDFVPSLLPQAAESQLPSGSPQSQPTAPQSAVEAFMSKRYSVPEYLVNN